MKKIIALALAAVLSLSMLGLLTACGGANDIERITVSENTTFVPGSDDGATIKIYTVWLKDTVDWTQISASERARIARAGFDAAQEKIAEGNVFNYSIMGVDASGTPIFAYDIERRVVLISPDGSGQWQEEVAVAAPNK
ncbi:MAG: hypothetical protein LBH56_01465 [Coriobacteriales bacterium]|jgi:hypothetical protein|nr:hypothetical protein [Coriobacteriales bacterium]